MGRSLVLVFGYETSALGPRGGPLEAEVRHIGEEAVGKVRAELSESHPGLTIEVEYVNQRAADAVIAVARARDAELVAVGHGGSGPLRAALLGSVAYEVVHRAPLPVLVVPNDEDDSE
jgi:nucleotide-binding universal stress UspA family protein